MVRLPALQGTAPLRSAARAKPEIGRRLRSLLRRRPHRPPRLNPILARLAWVTLIVFLAGTWYFHAVFGGAWLDAVYFVVTTMTTTGYGDMTPDRSKPLEIVAAMLLMLSGITLTGLFIAFGASLLTRVHWVTHARPASGAPPRAYRRFAAPAASAPGSSTCCSRSTSGWSSSSSTPTRTIVERAREQHFDLLTGDASRDTTLDLCNLARRTQPDRADQRRYLEPGDRARRARPQSDDADRAADRRGELCRVDRPAFRIRDHVLGRGTRGAGLRRPGAVPGIARTRRVWRSGVCDRRDRLGRPPADCAAERNPARRVARRTSSRLPHDLARSRSG